MIKTEAGSRTPWIRCETARPPGGAGTVGGQRTKLGNSAPEACETTVSSAVHAGQRKGRPNGDEEQQQRAGSGGLGNGYREVDGAEAGTCGFFQIAMCGENNNENDGGRLGRLCGKSELLCGRRCWVHPFLPLAVVAPPVAVAGGKWWSSHPRAIIKTLHARLSSLSNAPGKYGPSSHTTAFTLLRLALSSSIVSLHPISCCIRPSFVCQHPILLPLRSTCPLRPSVSPTRLPTQLQASVRWLPPPFQSPPRLILSVHALRSPLRSLIFRSIRCHTTDSTAIGPAPLAVF